MKKALRYDPTPANALAVMERDKWGDWVNLEDYTAMRRAYVLERLAHRKTKRAYTRETLLRIMRTANYAEVRKKHRELVREKWAHRKTKRALEVWKARATLEQMINKPPRA